MRLAYVIGYVLLITLGFGILLSFIFLREFYLLVAIYYGLIGLVVVGMYFWLVYTYLNNRKGFYLLLIGISLFVMVLAAMFIQTEMKYR